MIIAYNGTLHPAPPEIQTPGYWRLTPCLDLARKAGFVRIAQTPVLSLSKDYIRAVMEEWINHELAHN